MIQPVSFKGVYKILLPVYDAATLNNYIYDKKNEHKRFYANNMPVELFSDIDRNNYTSIEAYETDVYILTGEDAEEKKRASQQWIDDTIELSNPDLSLCKQKSIWNRATNKFLSKTKSIIENAQEQYTLKVGYNSRINEPKFTIVA